MFRILNQPPIHMQRAEPPIEFEYVMQAITRHLYIKDRFVFRHVQTPKPVKCNRLVDIRNMDSAPFEPEHIFSK